MVCQTVEFAAILSFRPYCHDYSAVWSLLSFLTRRYFCWSLFIGRVGLRHLGCLFLKQQTRESRRTSPLRAVHSDSSMIWNLVILKSKCAWGLPVEFFFYFWLQDCIVYSCSGAIFFFILIYMNYYCSKKWLLLVSLAVCRITLLWQWQTPNFNGLISSHTRETVRLLLYPGTAALYFFSLLHFVTASHLQWRPLVWRFWPCVAYSDVRDTQYPSLCLGAVKAETRLSKCYLKLPLEGGST